MTSITATFVGGPTLHLRYAGLTFLTDPTFDPPGEYPGTGATLRKLVGPAVPLAELGPVDVVLLSHDQHADNLDHAGRALLASVPTVLSTPDAAARIPGVRGLVPWEQATVGRRHGDRRPGAARSGGRRAAQRRGDRVRAAGRRVADGLRVGGQRVARRGRRDRPTRPRHRRSPCCSSGGANVGRFGAEPLTLDAARASAAADLLPGARVVPVHHTDWAHFVDPLAAVEERFAANGRRDRLVVLERGRPTEL